MEQTPDWSVNGIQTVEDAIRNEITDLLLKTAICLCNNADKRPSSPMKPPGFISVSRYMGEVWSWVSDQAAYGCQDPFHNVNFKEALLQHEWLYSVYNRSVRNVPRYHELKSEHSIYGFYTEERANLLCSPFEYIPIHILEELCQVYPAALQEFDSLIPANKQYETRERKGQESYIGAVNEKRSRAYQLIDQVITRFKKELVDELSRVYGEAEKEGRTLSQYNARPFLTERNKHMEFKDEFRLYDTQSVIYGLQLMSRFLEYPFREMCAFTPFGSYNYSRVAPYSNFQSNLAELYQEAIQCHYDMISRLIVLRLTLEKGQNTIEKKNVPYIVIPKLENNIRRTPKVSARRTKRVSNPKLPPGANIHYPKQGAALNSPNVNSPRANSNSRSRPKSKPKPRSLSVRMSGNKK